MPTPGEHKTVQARILAYAEAIHLRQGYGGQVGWTIVSREEAEQRRGFEPQMTGTDEESQENHLRKSAKSAVQFSSVRALPLFISLTTS